MATGGEQDAGDAGRDAEGARDVDNGRDKDAAASFASLLIMLSSSAWMALGKIADPVSGEVKKDLEGARFSIEILGMLREKTKGNLSREEERLLNGMIADLQANYAEAVFSEGGTSGGGQASGKTP